MVLNGEAFDLPEGATVADAVRAAGASDEARGVAVALDGEVLLRGEWQDTLLAAEAQIEVLRAVQGG